MMLDVFKDDAFSFTNLVKAINKIPHVPTRLGSLGIFEEQGVTTTSVAIEMQNGVLTLVPTAARGAPGPAKNEERRNVRDFRTVHLPQRVAVMADEVQGLRAFGTESEVEMASRLLNRKLAVARRDLDVTHEWQRVGVLKGEVLDSDGTTVIYNYFTEFGVSQQTLAMDLDVTGTNVRGKCVTISRYIEDELGGVMNSGYHVMCGDAFFDAFIDHDAVKDTFKYHAGATALREDLRRGFEFGGGMWENYRGKIGATSFIGTDDAYVIPLGVPDLFASYFAPAPYMETVNTLGLPFYAKQKSLDYDTGLEVQVQSNPLHICTRPRAIIKLTRT